MKTAIYIEDGTVQIVLTPETEFEKSALRSFESMPVDAKIFAGSFYDCRGGWVRQSSYARGTDMYGDGLGSGNDKSLILRARSKTDDGTD